MKASVIWNPKYGKFDGLHCDKVVSRCSTVEKVVEYFLARGFIEENIDRNTTVGINWDQSVVSRVDVYSGTKQKIQDEVTATVELAKSVFGTDLGQVKVKFYSDGCNAGKAYYKDMSVGFNVVLAHENPSTFSNTVKHEVSHLVVRKVFSRASAHGREFKSVFRKLGGNGERCHTYDVSSVKRKVTRTYAVIKCACTEHLVTPKRALKAHVLKCTKCKSFCRATGEYKQVTK